MREEFTNKQFYLLITDEGITIEDDNISKTFFPYGCIDDVSYISGGLVVVSVSEKKYSFGTRNLRDLRRLKKATFYAKDMSKRITTPSASIQCEQAPIEAGYVFDGGTGDGLLIEEDYIVIKHKGALNALAMGIHGDKTVYYTDITAVEFKKAGLSAGFIQFSIIGGNESRGGVRSAMGDENSVALSVESNWEAARVVEFIRNRIHRVKAASNHATTVVKQNSAADEIKKFKELLDLGIITQEEFDAKKKQLLGL